LILYDAEIKEVVKECEQIRNKIKEVEEDIEQNKRYS
jgi:peptidoglycan hydrolase CwlO-like protein